MEPSSGEVIFSSHFSGSQVSFRGAAFSSGEIRFGGAVFSGGEIRFPQAKFAGTEISFTSLRFPDGRIRTPPAEFAGASVDFSEVAEWSHPPALDWETSLPPGVKPPVAHQPAAKSLPPASLPREHLRLMVHCSPTDLMLRHLVGWRQNWNICARMQPMAAQALAANIRRYGCS